MLSSVTIFSVTYLFSCCYTTILRRAAVLFSWAVTARDCEDCSFTMSDVAHKVANQVSSMNLIVWLNICWCQHTDRNFTPERSFSLFLFHLYTLLFMRICFYHLLNFNVDPSRERSSKTRREKYCSVSAELRWNTRSLLRVVGQKGRLNLWIY